MLSIENNKEQLLKIILNCDPHLLDTACQIRAITLLHYYQLIKNATKENPLLPADEKKYIHYILLCEMLTHYGKPGFRDNINLNQLDLLIRPSKAVSSKSQKDTFFAKVMSEVAAESISFLQRHSNIRFDAGLIDYVENDILSVSSSAKKIKLLPGFISTQLMLNVMKHKQLLLIVNLHRILINNETREEETIGTARICYRYQDDRFQAIDPDGMTDTEAVTIYMRSYVPDSQNMFIEAFFSERDFDTFLAGFKAFDIAKIILMGAAAHVQHVDRANETGVLVVQHDFPRKPLQQFKRLQEISINLDVCSREQYEELYNVAHVYGLTGEKPSYSPTLIKHVYFSNLSECRVKLSRFLALDRSFSITALGNHGLFASNHASKTISKVDATPFTSKMGG